MSLRSGASAAALVPVLLACPSSSTAPDADATELAAEVEDERITLAELDAWIKEDLFRNETDDRDAAKLYEVRSQALQEMIRERALDAESSRRSVTQEELIDQEVEALGPVGDEEVLAFYEENRERLGEVEFEDVSERILDYLGQQRRVEAIQGIQERAVVTLHLEPPRFEVAASGPAMGPADARVVIVEFSDFQCPFCRRASSVVKELLERYPNDLRVVYRQYPLESIHPRARAAAEASLCAQDQDRFWAYHDKLFENSRKLGDDDLVRYAQELELDTERFEKCLAERAHQATVDEDIEAATELGLSGTPAFFLNGIPLSGARPAANFIDLIDQELGRQPLASRS